jgi:hypothetical protein
LPHFVRDDNPLCHREAEGRGDLKDTPSACGGVVHSGRVFCLTDLPITGNNQDGGGNENQREKHHQGDYRRN